MPNGEFEVAIETKSKKELVSEFLEKFSGIISVDENEDPKMDYLMEKHK